MRLILRKSVITTGTTGPSSFLLGSLSGEFTYLATRVHRANNQLLCLPFRGAATRSDKLFAHPPPPCQNTARLRI
jgi:hypothetical protein